MSSSGTVMLLRLSSSATTVLQTTLICEGMDGFSAGALAPLRAGDQFGAALASLPDLDGDGVPELGATPYPNTLTIG